MNKMVISDLPDSFYRGKRVFVRVDFNVPINNGRISEDYRIRRTIPTIDYLVEKGARVIVGSHLGRPGGTRVEALSLRPVALRLSELLGKTVNFVDDVIGEQVTRSVERLGDGEVLLLENLRFYREERESAPEFSMKLASLADLYVNDAFGTSHRSHASTHGMGEFFDIRLAGFLLNREITSLQKLRESPEHPYIVIVGGAKIKDKMSAVMNFLESADMLLIGGGVAYTFLLAKGVSIGKSITEDDDTVEWAREALATYGEKICLPVDHVVSVSVEKSPETIVRVVDDEIPDNMMGLDIGPRTVAMYTSKIGGKGSIFWNGPMGVFEVEDFANGTVSVARSVALATWRGATTVVGGGETISALRKAEVMDSEISHISTGGGSLLAFLGGEDLPGLTILNDRQNLAKTV